MPAKYLVTNKAVQKQLGKLPINIHLKIILSLGTIQKNPLIGSKLRGELENYFKYRVGDYRIVYKFDSKMSKVGIVKVEHRQGVYK